MRTYNFVWCPVVENEIWPREYGTVEGANFLQAFNATQALAQERQQDYVLLKLELVSL